MIEVMSLTILFGILFTIIKILCKDPKDLF